MRFVTLIAIVLGVVLLYVVYEIVRMTLLVRESGQLVRASHPYAREIPNAFKRILILGDSTAVGTGAVDPNNSTAGRLGTLYPEATIINRAENGFRLADLKKQLHTFDTNEHFDLVLVHIGANDILYLTPIPQIKEESSVVFSRVKDMGEKVVILHSGNVGDAPFFPWFLRSLFTSRSDAMRTIYRTEADIHGVQYVDLIKASTASLFKENPKKYHAPDLLHLSDEGYGLWFSEIQKEL